jgi:hypothetical protein
MNRDGILDLVISRGDIGTPDIVSVMLGVGDGTFGPRLDLPVAGAGDFDVADMNRDAIPDVLVAQPSLNRVRVLLGNGDGTLTELMDPLGGDIPSVIEDVEVADLNRDGIQDVVAAAGGLYYASNAGNGNLTHGIQINLGSTTIQRVRVADIDRDGYPDILATDQSAQLIVAFGPNFTTYVTSPLPANAWDLRIGPAEADGRPFVYMPLQGLSQVAVLAPTTPGAYSVAGVYADGTGPLAIAIADMNRDGLLDAVTANITLGQVSVLLHGPNVVTGIAEDAPLVARPRLDQNYPNPFNPSTTVRFSVPQKGTAQLRVFDVRGRLVRTLVDGMVLAGDHHVPWDGANDQGHPVASGVYLYRLTTAAGYGESKRMVLLR